MRRERGFTLIELLIVVAIIAILAAIAIPNFLAAQVRSKVSRVRGELRTVATGLESYYVDNNWYPLTAPTTTGSAAGVPVSLTTPVSYLSGVKSLVDPFIQPGRTSGESGSIAEKQWYTYHNLVWEIAKGNYLTFYPEAREKAYGDWRTLSVGPDGVYYNQPLPVNHGWRHVIEYDPTNGTNSYGNIYRSQKHGETFEWRGTNSSYGWEAGL
jgi:prepilin-type N-terminal cleavage/methylation domain-containing protein